MYAVVEFADNLKLTEEEQAQLKAACFLCELPQFRDDVLSQWYREFNVNLRMIPSKAWLGMKVKSHIRLPTADSTHMFEELEQKTLEAAPTFNQKVQVSVPGNGLMKIRFVQVYYDLCTEALQKLLDKGWTILAVCPQPDQRRPDYIMGSRTAPTAEDA